MDEGQWDAGSVATLAGNAKADFKNGPANEASFNQPFGVAVDPSGQLLVSDVGNHCVRCIDPRGEVSTFAGTAKEKGYRDGLASQAAFHQPKGLAVAEDGTVLVADRCNNRIRKITPQGEVSTVAGSGTKGFKDGSPSEACFYGPYGLALDGAGSIIVADLGNHRIRQVTAQGVSTLAGNGQLGNKDGPAQEASFSYPLAVAVGPNGHDVMATDFNGRLCLISKGRVSFVATGFNQPNGLLVDCRGNAIVADSCNHRILFCTPQGAVAVIAGNGQQAFKDGPSKEASFKVPMGLALDHQGRVVVADSLNHRVRALTLPSTKKLQLELASSSCSSFLPVGCSVTRSTKSLFKWTALLQVAEGPFRGGLFELSLEMPFDYPVSGPLVKFVPPLSAFGGHPNVDSETGEVSYGEWKSEGVGGDSQNSNIAQVLQQVQRLLEYPGQDLRKEQVRNKSALELWEHNRIQFDEEAYRAARQSWLCKLKPRNNNDNNNNSINEMVCDLLCPAKKISREAQHELFKAVAVPEIEEHVRKTYGIQQTPSQPVTLHLTGGANKQQHHLKQKQDLSAKYVKETSEEKQAGLKARLTKTLHSLLDLHNPRAEVLEWLERELARLCVEEAKQATQLNKQEEEGGGNNQEEQENKEGEADEDHLHNQAQEDLAVQELLFQHEGLTRPKTSEQCFELLATEAEKEAKRLGEKMEDCMSKYELLYSRMEQVRQIEDVPSANAPEVATKTKQPLDGSNQVLIAQAKRLEVKLRKKYHGLVDTFNVGLLNKKCNKNKAGNQQQQPEEDEEKKNDVAVNEEEAQDRLNQALLALPLAVREAINSSTLRLSSGLRVQVKFGPSKSMSRLKQKGPPRSVLDYTRATVVFADPLLLALFFDLFKATFKVVRVMNKFLLLDKQKKEGNNNENKDEGQEAEQLPQPPNVHVNFVFEGHVCEVQLFLEDFLWIKEFSHKPYEIVRLARDKKGNKKKQKEADSKELREAVEHILAEGVYDPHPGPALYPLLDTAKHKLLGFLPSQGQ